MTEALTKINKKFSLVRFVPRQRMDPRSHESQDAKHS